MDAELSDGSRVNATLFPISQIGNTITIRKFAKNPWTMTAMIKNGTISSADSLADLALHPERDKPAFLRRNGIRQDLIPQCLLHVLPPDKEDNIDRGDQGAPAPQLPAVAARCRRGSPTRRGRARVTLYNLMINALRQRPDIVLVGEIRTKKDAETLFEAIHTGHSVYGTVPRGQRPGHHNPYDQPAHRGARR